MKPGATTRPSASITWVAPPPARPISTITPFAIATSARRAGAPVPSTTMPFLIRRSRPIAVLPLDSAGIVSRPPRWVGSVRCARTPRPAPDRGLIGLPRKNTFDSDGWLDEAWSSLLTYGGVIVPFGGNDWLALTQEPALEPEIPICDPHHHFWDFRTS